MSQNRFRQILLSAVDEGLSSLGDSPKEAIFFHLEHSFKIKRENIPANLTQFEEALQRIFGPGASYLEKLIAQRFCERLGVPLEEETWSLKECVDKAKKYMPTKEDSF